MADIFVSYKKRDRDLVEALVRDLEAEGFTVWWDYEIDSGEDWLERILKEVDIARCVVGAWTRAAISTNGTFVPSEGTNINYVRIEHERGSRKLVPALCEADTTLPVQFADLQASDLTDRRPGDRNHPGFRSLVKRIEAYATPSWVQARVAGLEARIAQEESRRRVAETRAREVESAMLKAAEELADERTKLDRSAPQASAHAGALVGRLVSIGLLAAVVGGGVSWVAKPDEHLNLAGTWGGGEFTCGSVPLRLSVVDHNLLRIELGYPETSEEAAALEAVSDLGLLDNYRVLEGPNAGGWFWTEEPLGGRFGWRPNGDTLVWDTGAKVTSLTRCPPATA